jgi:chromosome segregation ATPase
MPTAGDDIETRLSIVEGDFAELRKQLALTSSEAAAARVLAAGADRDVSEVRAELRAHTQALNALRETQVDFSRQLADHGRRIDALDRRLDEQSREMREGFATLATGMAQITALLTNLDQVNGPRIAISRRT